MTFKTCRHATSLDLRFLEIGDLQPAAKSDEEVLLQRQSDAHELGHLKKLELRGRTIVEVPKSGLSLKQGVDLTHKAMRLGTEVIFQAALSGGCWGGYSDFLERVDRPSNFGHWSYEVVDTKLRRTPHPKHVLQLALYSELLAGVQGVLPEYAHLELGDGSRFTVRLSQVSAYARHARTVFENFLKEQPETRPEPVAACTLCRWKEHCQGEWNRRDSLALVAGITRSQRNKLEKAGINTMSELAQLSGSVPKLAPDTQRRLATQARLQVARRAGGPPSFELRTPEAGKGFDLLPRPAEGDVFYDIEGDPYHEGGLEYLHGLWFCDDGEWQFKAIWAHDRIAEGKAVAELLDFLLDRLARYPKAHTYHYANYEVAALRRLTAEHRVGEAAMDQLLRERRFVDLYKVVSGGLIASEKGYSIKDLEAFYMGKRSAEVATAGASVVFYEKWRETHEHALLDLIYDYNRTDCISTQLLRDWLLQAVRPTSLAWPRLGPTPKTEDMAATRVSNQADTHLAKRFKSSKNRLGRSVAMLLADLSQFYKREDNPGWWAIYDRLAQDSEALLDDLDSVFGLEAIDDAVRVTAKSFERTYRYPAQATKLRAGKKPCIKPATEPQTVDLRSLDPISRTIVLRRSASQGELPGYLHLLPDKPRDKRVLEAALARTIEVIIDHPGEARAVEQLITRGSPCLTSGHRLNHHASNEADLCSQISATIGMLDGATLGIQGPPGTGKTYVSALAIIDLVRAGKRVAVSSNSHQAIANLLEAVALRAKSEGVECKIVQKGKDDGGQRSAGIIRVDKNDAPEIGCADVVGATAWHFARYKAPAFDYLFIDEAGQVSLANVLAMALSARNLVLVGDPMQLPQPLQGTHPGDSGLSCLEYLLGGERIIPADRGFFIPSSRRMHPLICAFISEAVYEGKLRSDTSADRQILVSTSGQFLAGAAVQPVAHSGNSQTCDEEVTAVHDAIQFLVGSTYRSANGLERRIDYSDILVVAPYNAQVNALKAALPHAVRVGTVDRFQGQEAPVCLISMTTSSSEEMPRDMSFLFSINRINVAVSRAQVRAVVFASPQLLDTPCNTIEEMTLVNALCLLAEHGRHTR